MMILQGKVASIIHAVFASVAFIIVASVCIVAEGQECALSSVCKNGGTCRVLNGKDTCECLAGYFDIVCGSYASSLEIVLRDNRGDNRADDWWSALRNFNLIAVTELSRSRTFRVTYAKPYHPDDLTQIRQLLSREDKVSSAADFNECSNGNPCVGEHNRCANTEGSFQCSCESGYKISNDKCVQEVDSAKRTIFIWSAGVGTVVILMLALVCYINMKKVKRGKKLARIARAREEAKERKLQACLQTIKVKYFSRSRQVSPRSSTFGSSSQTRSGAPLYTIRQVRHNPRRTSTPRGITSNQTYGSFQGDFARRPRAHSDEKLAQYRTVIEELKSRSVHVGYNQYREESIDSIPVFCAPENTNAFRTRSSKPHEHGLCGNGGIAQSPPMTHPVVRCHVNVGYDDTCESLPRSYVPAKTWTPTHYSSFEDSLEGIPRLYGQGTSATPTFYGELSCPGPTKERVWKVNF